MLLKRFYDDKLAQASYLVGCAATGEALVIDPHRDVTQYLRAAEAEGLRVSHVTETHIHADFVSGSRELARRTGAKLLLSAEGGADWQYAFARDAGAVLLRDQDMFMVGNVKVEVLHTPGHTPEHLSFMITDTAATDRPMGVFTGDFLFAGDVGRPDLLERAAKIRGTMDVGARTLYRSLQAFKRLPDYLQIWPGHGAGSACGKSLGAIPSTTLGYERIVNWGLAATTEDRFVEAVLAGQPEPPRYFAEMKRVNREGPRILGDMRAPVRLPERSIATLLAEGATIVDTRPSAEFAGGHIPGTINIPLNKSFATWAGWLLAYDRPFYLIATESPAHGIGEAARDLAMIGLDQISGYFGDEAMDAWIAEGRTLERIPQMTAGELAEALVSGTVALVDVRGAAEWASGRLPGAPNIPLGLLNDHIAELPADKPLVVYCQGGSRSAIAASVLRARSVPRVINLAGGFAEWQARGLSVERAETAVLVAAD
jgi:hydroxyacylglutathione hydrolase